jgi:hypothetical protein
MTKVKKLEDRVCKICISLDSDLLKYLDDLEGTRSSNIAKAIVDFRLKQRQVSYARILRDSIHRKIKINLENGEN